MEDNGAAEAGLAGKHSVCNFSRKYLWRMAVTHYREPQEVIVAGPDQGRGKQTETAGPVSYCSQPSKMEGYKEGSMSK